MNYILKHIATICFLLLTYSATAQYTSNNGWFSVNEISGCTGLTVNITISTSNAPCICTSGCSCAFDYNGDGTYDPKSNPLTYTFTEPGNFRLTILFPNPYGADYIDITIADNLPPDFNIYSCAGETILLDITDTNFDNYIIDYGDGSSETVAQGTDPLHNYADNTVRTVSVRGLNTNAADNCSAASATVTPLSALPAPAIPSLIMLDNSSVRLDYSLQNDILYHLEVRPPNASNFSFVKIIDEATQADTIRNLSLSDDYYCFRITAINPCTNNVAAYSNISCSIDLDLSVQNDVNILTWKTSDPDNNFTLLRDDLLSRPVSASARMFNDTNINCNTDYCYTLVANNTNGYTSTSLPQCGTAFSTSPPAQVNNISTVVDGTSVNILWEPPPGEITEYTIKREANSFFSTIATTSDAQYQDEGLATAEQSYCYKVGVADACDNSTEESITACSILLKGSIDRLNNIELSWNNYEGWANGVANYTVEKSYPSGGGTQSAVNSNSFSEIDLNNNEQVIQYRVTAQPTDNTLPLAVSNVITIIKPVNIYYPNAFTPDGNDTNEEFKVQGRFITSYELRIYNRWGELIFVSENMDQGWDGIYNGTTLPQGTYAFSATMQDMAGREITKTGSILLIRK